MSGALRQPAWWQIWANPILARYARSQLRPLTLATWVLVVMIITAFGFFVIYLNDLSTKTERTVAANDAFVPVLAIQTVLLLLMGTGSVATGVTREADEGMTSYVRLTPMKPFAKIVGYLFGLPIREYVLFLTTLPFAAFCISAGSIGWGRAIDIYFILFLAAVLYHLTGCVAGTVIKNRRFVARATQTTLVLLYLVLPRLSGFGFDSLQYLTLLPAFTDQLSGISFEAFKTVFPQTRVTVPSVPFFDERLSRIQFTMLVQGTLIFTFCLILFRKWRQETHHLLSKGYSLLLYLWILLVIIANALPMAKGSRDFFPKMYTLTSSVKVDPRAAFVVVAMFGLGVLVLSCLFLTIISPTGHEYKKALRRARKLGRRRIPIGADGATAYRHALVMALAGAAFWSYFAQGVAGSDVVGTIPHDERALRAVPFAICLYILCYHGALERFGRRVAFLFVLFAWIVPILGGLILAAARASGVPVQVVGLSGFAAPFYLLTLPLEKGDLNGDTAQLMRISISFSVFAHAVLALYLQWGLGRHRARVRRSVTAES